MSCEKKLTRLTLSLYGHWGLNHLILPWMPPPGTQGPPYLRDTKMDMQTTKLTFSQITEFDIVIGENFRGLGSVISAATHLVHLRVRASCSWVDILNQIPLDMQWLELERLELIGIEFQKSTMFRTFRRFRTLAPRLKGISFIECKFI